MATDRRTKNPFEHLINLANPLRVAKTEFCTDAWFAPCEHMLQLEPLVSIPDRCTVQAASAGCACSGGSTGTEAARPAGGPCKRVGTTVHVE